MKTGGQRAACPFPLPELASIMVGKAKEDQRVTIQSQAVIRYTLIILLNSILPLFFLSRGYQHTSRINFNQWPSASSQFSVLFEWGYRVAG